MLSIEVKDSNDFLKEQDDFSADLIFCDPPYALGSEVIIKENGKPDYKKARDFMDKWDMPTGEYWEEFFKEAFRVLKHGGYLLMYSIDRQNFLFKYYAHLADFQERQSLYWYYISNFPKAADLSKMIDKHFGAKRKVVGKNRDGARNGSIVGLGSKKVFEITAPTTYLAKKYDGYKYSQAPLKQVVEEIMIFQKPYKTGSCLYDVLAMESGDDTITCGALNIDGNRVGMGSGKIKTVRYPDIRGDNYNQGKRSYEDAGTVEYKVVDTGRYPAQAFVDSEAAKRLDKQNSDAGGVSKILYKCDYEEEMDLFIYNPKASRKERNAGLEDFPDCVGGGMKGTENQSLLMGSGNIRNNKMKNYHPTVKPISLNEKILRLFKTPNPQTILIPFGGSGSEVIGAMKAGFETIKACEINEEYVKIAKARIRYWGAKIQYQLF